MKKRFSHYGAMSTASQQKSLFDGDDDALQQHVVTATLAVPRNNDRRLLPVDVKPYIISPQVMVVLSTTLPLYRE